MVGNPTGVIEYVLSKGDFLLFSTSFMSSFSCSLVWKGSMFNSAQI